MEVHPHPTANDVADAAGVTARSDRTTKQMMETKAKDKDKVNIKSMNGHGSTEHDGLFLAGIYNDDDTNDNGEEKSRHKVTCQGCSRVFIVKGTFQVVLSLIFALNDQLVAFHHILSPDPIGVLSPLSNLTTICVCFPLYSLLSLDPYDQLCTWKLFVWCCRLREGPGQAMAGRRQGSRTNTNTWCANFLSLYLSILFFSIGNMQHGRYDTRRGLLRWDIVQCAEPDHPLD